MYFLLFFTPAVVTKTASGVKVAAGGGGGVATGNGNSNSNGAAQRTPTGEPSNGVRPPQTVKDKSAGKEKSALLTSKCILRTITAFLASNKRNSYNAQMRAKQTNRQRRQRKMDELSGKINPKLLENLRKKTKFSK